MGGAELRTRKQLHPWSCFGFTFFLSELLIHNQKIQPKIARDMVLSCIINLTTVSKNTYVTGFLGSFQTPNPHIPSYNKYVRITKIISKSMQPITKLRTINVLRGMKRPQKTVVRLILKRDLSQTRVCIM